MKHPLLKVLLLAVLASSACEDDTVPPTADAAVTTPTPDAATSTPDAGAADSGSTDAVSGS